MNYRNDGRGHAEEREASRVRRVDLRDTAPLGYVTLQFLRLVNSADDLHSLMREATRLLQEWSGCAAVGIRLRDGDDFPYFETRGFPVEFIQAENRLCVHDLGGQLARDELGNPILECMCGNILCGRFNPALPFFTSGGSFWSNSTSQLLATTTEADRLARTRNRCNGEGYESVALIPLRADGNTFGLLQLNDFRADRFTAELIASLEGLAAALAEAVARQLAVKELRSSQEQLQAEAQKLRESERHFRGLLDAVDQSAMLMEPDGTICECNEVFATRLNQAREDLLGCNVYDLLPPEIAEQRRRRVEEVQRLQSTVSFVDERWGRRLSHRVVPILDDKGDVVRLAVQGADITEQSRLEEVLRQSENHFKSLYEQAPLGYQSLDAEGCILEVNQAWLDLLGYTRDEVLGRSFGDFMTAEDHPKFVTRFPGFKERGEVHGCEVNMVRKDGSSLTVSIDGRVARDGHDRFLRTHCILHDVTARKQAEEAIRQSQAELRAIYDNSPIMMCVLDAERRLLYMNCTMTDFIGKPEDELRGQPACGIIGCINALEDPRGCGYGHECESCTLRLALLETLQTGRPRRMIERRMTIAGDDGPQEVVLLASTALIQTDAGDNLLISLGDITEQRKAEESVLEAHLLRDTVLQHTHMMTVYLDSAFNFVWVNQSYADSCKHDPDFFPGRNHFDLYPHAENQAIFQRVVDTGEPFTVTAKPFVFPNQPERGVTFWDWSLVPVKDPAGGTTGLVFTLVDVTEQRKAANELATAHRNLEAIWSIATIVDADLNSTFDHVVTTLVHMTESPFGFFGLLDEDESVMTIHAWSGDAMESCSIRDKPIQFPIAEAGIWAEAVRQRKPLILNNYSADHPSKKGYPVGHVPLTKLVAVPVFSHGKIVSLAAVANRQADYSEDDIAQISVFMHGIQSVIECKLAEEALRESEQRFRGLFDNAIVAVALHEIVLDEKDYPIDYVLLHANAAFERQIGHRLAEIQGKRVTEIFPADEASRFIAIYRKVVLTGVPADFESYSAALDRNFSVSAYRVGLRRFATVFLDITDRVRAAATLRESEERFRKTFDEAPIGAAIVGLDHRFQRVNEALCRITGYEAGELMARTFDDITHPDDLVADSEQAQKLADGLIDRYSMDKRYIRKDGKIAWVHLSVRLLNDQAGQPRGFLSMIIDITDRKHMETLLQDSEALLTQAEEIVGMGSFIWDVESDRFSSSNGMHRLYGLSEREFPDSFLNVLLQLVHPHDQDRIRTEADRMVAERRAWPVEFRIVRSDGQERLIHCESLAFLGTDGQVIRYIGTVQDITDRRADEIRFDAMQQQLHHASRLAVMGEMAAGIAHEVNQPLCSIVNFAKACQNVAAHEPVDLDKIRQWTAAINTAATRAGEIVHGLLKFARRHGPDWEFTTVRGLLDDAVLLVRHEAESRGVVLQTELSDEDLKVWVQPGQVQQVLVNLLRNGIEVLSSLADREKRITVTTTRTPDGVEISVADNGDGVTEKELQRLFEPFYTTKPQGLGLGLAINRTIVEDHGGRIEAAFNSYGGMTFRFTLPGREGTV